VTAKGDVVFDSRSDNLGPGDTNDADDVFFLPRVR
jgi:hypothetical protein